MIETTENTIKHIAIIMDGNRRWAASRSLPKVFGFNEGSKTAKKIAIATKKRGIPYLTIWGLSTENLKERGPEELSHLFSLFEKLADELEELNKEDIRIKIIGDLSKLPESTQKKLGDVEKLTANNNSLVVNLAINYGGRDELVRAFQKISNQNLKPEDINEELISQNLDTAGQPDVDLMIRTGGHLRFSGYLIWQSIYAELYSTKTTWPDFSEQELDKAIEWFQQQQRNHGK
ncbi:MAG: undecaprenyl pyrophosphate synthase [uncultured bacterium]|nr:MAG: undecaprenyl pyrophosphate synthase [uncultured bacterium]